MANDTIIRNLKLLEFPSVKFQNLAVLCSRKHKRQSSVCCHPVTYKGRQFYYIGRLGNELTTEDGYNS